jgi:drug/metabolite transporter (DMT)-like permease
MPPFTAVALRFAIASTILFGLAKAMKVPLGRQPGEKLLWLMNGLLFFSVSYGVVYWSEQYVPSGLSSVLFALFPLLVALLAHVALPAERLRPVGAAGTTLGFMGVLVIFSEDFSKLGGRMVFLGALVMLVSPVVSAIASVAIKRYGAGIHPLSIAAVPMAIATVVMAALALTFERGRSLRFTPASVGALLYLAICGSAVTFTTYYWLLRHVPAARLSLVAYATPVVAVVVGVVFLHEPLTPRLVAGAALVVGGVALAR